jgi:Ca2+-binding RTX toxin-like protein
VGLDLSSILSPINSYVQKIKAFTDKFQPVLSFLDRNLPVLDRFGMNLKITDLINLLSKFPGGHLKIDTSFLKSLNTINGIINTLTNIGSIGNVNLGSFSVDINGAINSGGFVNGAAQARQLLSGRGSVNIFDPDLGNGLSFTPTILNNPASAFGLLLGNPNVDLFNFSVPGYTLEGGGNTTVPIWALPPVSIGFGGDISASISPTVYGYDARGFLEYSSTGNTDSLFNGLYLDSSNKPGFYLNAKLYGDANVGFARILSAGGQAYIQGNLQATLNDPNADGKIRWPEIKDNFNGGGFGSIFDVSGGVSAGANVYVDYPNIKFKYGLPVGVSIERRNVIGIGPYPIPGLEFTRTGSRQTGAVSPDLAFASGGVLRLNVGLLAFARTYVKQDIGENYSLTGGGGSIVVKGVTAGEYSQTFGGVGSVVADSGSGNDRIDASGVTVPVNFAGGIGDDILSGGGGNDTLKGGLDNDYLVGNGGNDSLSGDDGNDLLDGGDGIDTLSGDSGNDVLSGGSGNDLLSGGTGNDTLSGGLGDDNLSGGSDNDTLQGEDGNDTLSGGFGNDLLSGGAGNDTLSGDWGNDNISGDDGDDALFGGGGNDTLTGGNGTNTLQGEEGDDVLYSGPGRDTLFGGAGNDTLFGSDAVSPLYGGTGNDSLVAGAGNDNLTGEEGNDTLIGNLGNDTLSGGENNDSLSGGFGNDYLTGEGGNDSLFGDEGNDTLVDVSGLNFLSGGAGNDTLTGGTDADTLQGGSENDSLIGAGGNDLLYGGYDADTLDGGIGNDTVYGEEGNDRILGGADNDSLDGGTGDDNISGDSGNDTLSGGDGVDVLDGGDGNDILAGDGGRDSLNGGVGADILSGGADNDTLAGGNDGDTLRGDAGDDSLLGEAGNDSLEGNDGNDTLQGGLGADSLSGGAGDDVLRGHTIDLDTRVRNNDGNDILDGGEGNDVLWGSDGADSLVGGAGNDSLFGDDSDNPGSDSLKGGADTLEAGAGNDWLYGGLGNDVLRAGSGFDRLFGGWGDDTLYGYRGTGAEGVVYVLAPGCGTDTIIDFDPVKDVIFLTGGLSFNFIDIVQDVDPSGTVFTKIIDLDTQLVLAKFMGITKDKIGRNNIDEQNVSPDRLQFRSKKPIYAKDETISLVDTAVRDPNGAADLEKIDFWLKTPNGTWQDRRDVGITGVKFGNADWGDFDKDGDLDVLVTGYTSAQTTTGQNGSVFDLVPVTKLYRFDKASNQFIEVRNLTNVKGNFDLVVGGTSPLAGLFDGTVYWRDINGDGLLDIVQTGSMQRGSLALVYIYLQNSTGNFDAAQQFTLDRPPSTKVSWQRLNSDNTLDFTMGEGSFVITNSNGVLNITRIGFIESLSRTVNPQNAPFRRQYGSTAGEYTEGMAIDSNGNIYITGGTGGSLGGSNRGNGDAFIAKYRADGTLLWTRQLGTDQLDTSDAITTDSEGNVYITGATIGNLNGSNRGSFDAYIAKYDKDGKLLWTSQLGSDKHDHGEGITTDSEKNVYFVFNSAGSPSGFTVSPGGYTNKGDWDVFIAKYDPTGKQVWIKQLATTAGDHSRFMTSDSAGNIYITGLTTGFLGTLGGAYQGGWDAFIAKYDKAGNQLWVNQLGGAGNEEGWGVAVDSAGNVYITGYTDGSLPTQSNEGGRDWFIAKYDKDGKEVWVRQYGTNKNEYAFRIALDNAGNAYITGDTYERDNTNLPDNNIPSSGDVFIAKYDPNGNLLSTSGLGSNQLDNVRGLVSDRSGNLYVGGHTTGSLGGPNQGGSDIFLAKIDVSEPREFVKQINIPGNEYSEGMTIDRAGGNIYIIGSTANSVENTPYGSYIDAFIAKYDLNGNLLWTRQLGTDQSDSGDSITTDTTGNVYVTGGTFGSLGGTNPNQNIDAYIAKYDSNGKLLWTRQLSTPDGDYGEGISTDSAGNVYVVTNSTGSLGGVTNRGDWDVFIFKYDRDGNPLWNRPVQLATTAGDHSRTMTSDSAGNIYITGFTLGSLNGANQGFSDAFIAKYKPTLNGNLELDWIRQLGSTGSDEAWGVAVDSAGNVYITGYTDGSIPTQPNTNKGGVDAFIAKYAPNGTRLWVRQLGTTKDKNEYAYRITLDGAGNPYITGDTNGTIGGNNLGDEDVFIAKYDTNGNLLSTSGFGTAGKDRARGIVSDRSGNIYVGGFTTGSLGGPNSGGGDIFLAKIDTSPAPPEFKKQLGSSSDDYGYGIAGDSAGNIYITGETDGSLKQGVSPGVRDAFIAKYGPDGKLLWIDQLGSTGDWDIARGIVSDSAGNLYITGVTSSSLEGTNQGSFDAFIAKYDQNGNRLWVRQFGGNHSEDSKGITSDSKGNVYVTGYTESSLEPGANPGGTDAFIAKYAANGAQIWVRQLGTSDRSDHAFGITSDSADNVYITGYTKGSLGASNQGDEDAFIAKYDQNGNRLWVRQLGSDKEDWATKIISDGQGNVYIAGLTAGSLPGNTNQGGHDAFIAKYDKDGTLLWVRQLGTNKSEQVWAMTLDSAGNIYISGNTDGTIGGSNQGGTDVFIAKYAPDGTLLSTSGFGSSDTDNVGGMITDRSGNLYLTGHTWGSLASQNQGGSDIFLVKVDKNKILDTNTIAVSSSEWTDFNGDGVQDKLLQTGYDRNINKYFTRVYDNTSGTLSLLTTNLPAVADGTAIWGDYDKDGKKDDILMTGKDPATGLTFTRIYTYNNTTNTFTEVTIRLAVDSNGNGILDPAERTNLTSFSGAFKGDVVWADFDKFDTNRTGIFDRDGGLDILMTGFGDQTRRTADGQRVPIPITKLYRLVDAAQNIYFDTNIGLSGVANSSVEARDYNGDGSLDILITGEDIFVRPESSGQVSIPDLAGGNPTTTIYRNDSFNAAGQFTGFRFTNPVFTVNQNDSRWASFAYQFGSADLQPGVYELKGIASDHGTSGIELVPGYGEVSNSTTLEGTPRQNIFVIGNKDKTFYNVPVTINNFNPNIDFILLYGNQNEYTVTAEGGNTRITRINSGLSILITGVTLDRSSFSDDFRQGQVLFATALQNNSRSVNFVVANKGSSGDDTLAFNKVTKKFDQATRVNQNDLLIDQRIQGQPTVFGALAGGEGNDTLIGSQTESETLESGVFVTYLDGGEGNDILEGSDLDNQRDILLGWEGDDTIIGKKGSDFINGGSGNDNISAGNGDDTIEGGPGNDTIDGGPGDGSMNQQNNQRSSDTVTYENDPAGVDVNLASTARDGYGGTDTFISQTVENAIGSNYYDSIVGTSNRNELQGRAGRDTLNGGLGDDTLDGGTGNDSLLGGAGMDTLRGGGGADILEGGLGTDTYELIADPQTLENAFRALGGNPASFQPIENSPLGRISWETFQLWANPTAWPNQQVQWDKYESLRLIPDKALYDQAKTDKKQGWLRQAINGTVIRDSDNNNTLILDLDLLPTGIKWPVNIQNVPDSKKVGGLKTGTLGFIQFNNSLGIDINADGAYDPAQDLTIENYFSGTESGSGHISNITLRRQNTDILTIKGTDIITANKYFTPSFTVSLEYELSQKAGVGANQTLSTNGWRSQAIWGDYNNDNKFDFLLIGKDANNNRIASVYQNLGGGFASIALTGFENFDSGVWGDYNGDGFLDILATGSNDNATANPVYGFKVLLFNPSRNGFFDTNLGTLSQTYTNPINTNWVDLDNNGRTDIIITSGNTLEFILGNGTIDPINTGINSPALTTGDLDNDGYIDLIVTGNNGIKVYRNVVDPRNSALRSFTELTNTKLSGAEGASLADYNRDGFLDVLLMTKSGTHLFKNNNNLTFTYIPNPNNGQPLPTVINGSASWGDFDAADGDLDLLLTGTDENGNAVSRVFTSGVTGGALLSEESTLLPGAKNGVNGWHDYDGDGDLDFVFTGASGKTEQPVLSVYRNNARDGVVGIRPNPRPPIPVNFTTNINGNTVTLGWQRITDTTPLAANSTGTGEPLSYNLRLGTTPGGSDVIAPLADSNGNRKVSALGNVGYNISQPLNLIKGITYYWSVQSVDNGYLGSTFAPEQTFTINPFITSNLAVNLATLPRVITGGGTITGDYDNDGRLDRAVLSGNTLTISRATTTGFVAYTNQITPAGTFNTLTQQDVNGDGKLDIILLNTITNAYQTLINDAGRNNTAPVTPLLSQSVVNNNTVTFSWTAASDTPIAPATTPLTPANGLTYRISLSRITGPNVPALDRSILVAPNPAGVPSQSGNVNVGTIANGNISWTENNLPPGEFNWTVQTLDGSLIASAPTPQRTLRILPQVSFSNLNPSPEGDSGTSNLTLTLNLSVAFTNLSAAFTQPVTIDFAAFKDTGDTAEADVDFSPVSGTVTFAPGTTSQTLSIPIIGDKLPELTETFTVLLQNPSNALLPANTKARVSITNEATDGMLLNGTAGADALTGGPYNDSLIGGAGNDTLNGGAGNDTLVGGANDDTYFVDTSSYTVNNGNITTVSADVIIEENNGGIDTVNSSVNYSLVSIANVENITLTGADPLNATGNELANRIIGNIGDNKLTGGAGNDTIDGGAGNDTIVESGDFNFTLTNATLTGNGTDTLTRIESAQLGGGTGNNRLDASGFTGTVILDGGGGIDTLIGGAGDDTYIVDTTGDVITEAAIRGNDTIISTVTYTLANLPNVENLTITGNSAINATGNGGNNLLIGNEGANTMIGNAGDDILVGMGGRDTLSGGAGKDNFLFNAPGEGIDTITDFNVIDDTLNVIGGGFGGLVAGNAITPAQFSIGSSATTADHRFIYNRTTGALFFDVDGSGAGAAVQFASLSPNLNLTTADIFIGG